MITYIIPKIPAIITSINKNVKKSIKSLLFYIIISLLKNGQTTDECFCGEWYKLKIANTPAKFEFFVIRTNLYKNKVLSDNIIIDTAESLKCFEKEKVGIITKKIKESIENDDWNGISININLY